MMLMVTSFTWVNNSKNIRIVVIVSFDFGHLFNQFPRSVLVCLTVARQ